MKNVQKMIQTVLKKFTVLAVLGVFLVTSLVPVSAATKVSKIKWTSYRKTMYIGNPQKFTVQITPSSAAKTALKWKTSNKKIVKVSSNGTVTPVKTGKGYMLCEITEIKESDMQDYS